MLDWCYSSSWHISRDGLALHMTILFSSWIVHPWCTKIAIIKTNQRPAPQTIAIILNPWAYLLNRFALAQFSAIEHGRYKPHMWTIKPKLKPYKRKIKGLPVWGRIINHQCIGAVMGQITHCYDTNDQVNNPATFRLFLKIFAFKSAIKNCKIVIHLNNCLFLTWTHFYRWQH